MNGISEYPPESDFGLSFDYGTWTEGATITLCTVPWNNGYDDVVEFASNDELNKYIETVPSHKPVVLEQLSYLRPGMPIKIDVPLNIANKFNYVKVSNPKLPSTGVKDVQRDFYYFILETSNSATDTTYLALQLDVWQSYRRLVKFLRAFVEVSHMGVANELQTVDGGREWLTNDESMDLGAEYEVKRLFEVKRLRTFDALITTTTNVVTSPGTSTKPLLNTATGGSLQGVGTATTTYRIALSDLSSYMGAMTGYPWITQGITRVVIVPALSELGVNVQPVQRENNYPPGPSGSPNSYLHRILSNTSGTQYDIDVDFNIEAYRDEAMAVVGSRYRHLRKFATSPYCFIEVSTGYGDSFTYRPELFPDSSPAGKIGYSLFPGSERVEFSAREYNASLAGNPGDQYASAVSINNLPTLPVVNNMAIASLAANVHSRNAQRTGAAWGQQNAMYAAQVGFENTRMSAYTAAENEQAGRNLSELNQWTGQRAERGNAMLNIAGAIMGGGASGGMGGGGSAGAAAGASMAGIGASMSALAMLNTQASERDQLQATIKTGAGVSKNNFNTTMSNADSNRSYAEWSAKGTHSQAIRAINAQVQDTMLTQPGMSGQYGGEFLRLLQKGFTFEARIKMIDRAAIKRIGEYWLRHGYVVNAYTKLPTDLMVMSKFSYWRVREVYVDAAPMPELFKQALKGIMQKGVTVWAKPEMIGYTDPATNVPKRGIKIDNGA